VLYQSTSYVRRSPFYWGAGRAGISGLCEFSQTNNGHRGFPRTLTLIHLTHNVQAESHSPSPHGIPSQNARRNGNAEWAEWAEREWSN